MFKKVVIVLAVILAALAAFVATRPADYRVVRSRTIAAPPDVVHAYVSDFHKWPEWSPWEKLDPAMKRDFSGAPSGTGAFRAVNRDPANSGLSANKGPILYSERQTRRTP